MRKGIVKDKQNAQKRQRHPYPRHHTSLYHYDRNGIKEEKPQTPCERQKKKKKIMRQETKKKGQTLLHSGHINPQPGAPLPIFFLSSWLYRYFAIFTHLRLMTQIRLRPSHAYRKVVKYTK